METQPLLRKVTENSGGGEGRGEGGERGGEEEEEKETKESGGTGCKHKACSVVVIFACFVVLCTQGIDYAFGNMNPYLTSYLRNASHGDVDYTDSLWIIQTSALTACICQALAGLLANRLPVRLFMLIGIIFEAGFLFGSYWAVKTSFWAVWFTYGIIGGIPAGFLYPTCLKISAMWVPEKKGLVIGVILMGYGIGALVWNALTTWYINHDNLQPDLRIGKDVYYTQSAVLDKVPSCFLVLGAALISLQFLSLIFISTPPPTTVLTKIIINEDNAERSVPPVDEEKQSVFPRQQQNADNEQEIPEYHWKQAVKTRVFWTIWWAMLGSSLGLSFVIPLFKAYGQTFIADDHFLASVAMASSVFNAAGRPFWGLLADRFGARIIALVTQCLLAILMVTFTSCERTGEVAFFFWVCAMFLVMCGLFTATPLLVLAAFGPHHFNANMGLISSYGVIGAVVPAVIASPLKNAFGWNGLFFVGFAGQVLGILLNMSLDWFKCGNRIPRNMFAALGIQR